MKVVAAGDWFYSTSIRVISAEGFTDRRVLTDILVLDELVSSGAFRR